MSSYADAESYAREAYPRLARLARSLTGDWHEAEDLLQTTLTKTFVAWKRVAAADDVDAYVRRTMTNAFLSERRRGWFRRERAREDTADIIDARVAEDPSFAVVDQEAALALLADLPPRQRAVLALRYVDGLSDEEIADIVDCSRQAVAAAAYRGLQRLRTGQAQAAPVL